MKRGLHELSEREKSQAQDQLMIPMGEFAALFAGALLVLSLLFGPATLKSAARHVALASVATFSGAIGQIGTIGTRMEARASEHGVASGKPQ